MTKPGIDFPGVGVGLAIVRDGKLLLCRRLKAPEAGYWNIVGGKVDHLEPTEIAARREAEEETGLSIGAIEFVTASEQIIEADRQHWISLLYRTSDFTGEPQLTEPDKLAELTWFDLENLPEPLSVFTRALLPYLR
ncbi:MULTISPECIES: NUDIX domain-containing protein [Alphaproteobacteria]|uniref:DNA mismatch repair protein MutT n=2 Tax=Alphaproteobacteria TaxID=28211 RepID=A0A512HCP4_9HYPH|nr:MULTISPECIES: NUDIX domain-containing protein [Alphaproteobacteria]GEO83215.1 DNA mismatch repair protein MutT [Ciceribacter naphthalenivorans]GLR20390.1 DNA mismatch repair protein MutT [Ciceribacter naphthalenivorans]GLT03246.1 DNA mismatch repair protein MutT [Sphingomonas psychrolutea]